MRHDDDKTIAEIADAENWPVMTLEWFGRRRSFQIPPALIEDGPALSAWVKAQLERLRQEARS